jgi:DNA helicase II / ATP-dependent DNA helicase PcrA
MKEERPRGDFHIEEERRLFYVSLTRAEQNLTLSTIVGKRKKASPFLDDFLEDPKIQKFDATQLTPSVKVPPSEEGVGSLAETSRTAQLFGPASEKSRVYSHIALWAKAYHPPVPEPLQMSASAIDAYRQCPMKYMFGHLWKISGGPGAMLTFGNVMHTTIREVVSEIRKGRKISLDEVLGIYDREWSSAGFPDDYHEQEYKKAGREQLEAFYERYSAAPADVLHQEKTFELPLEHDVVIKGRMDQVNRLAGDSIEIVDYKTGKLKDQANADRNTQLSIYALAARELLDANPERLSLHYLMAGETVSTTRDAKALAAIKQTILEVADQIRAGEFSAKKGYLCKFCDYKPLCPAQEDLISIRPTQSPAPAS